MAIAHFENESRVNDFHASWVADFDDVTKDLTVNCTQVDERNGQPFNGVGEWSVFILQTNGQERGFDLFGLGLVNAGPTTFNNVSLRTFTQRGNGLGISYRTSYKPPAR